MPATRCRQRTRRGTDSKQTPRSPFSGTFWEPGTNCFLRGKKLSPIIIQRESFWSEKTRPRKATLVRSISRSTPMPPSNLFGTRSCAFRWTLAIIGDRRRGLPPVSFTETCARRARETRAPGRNSRKWGSIAIQLKPALKITKMKNPFYSWRLEED